MAEAPAVVPLTEATDAFPHPCSPSHPQPQSHIGNGSCQYSPETTTVEMEPTQQLPQSDQHATHTELCRDGVPDSYLPLLTSASASRACDDGQQSSSVAPVDSFDSADQQTVSHFVNDERALPAMRDTVIDTCAERRDSGTSETKVSALPPHGPKPKPSPPLPGASSRPAVRALRSGGEGHGQCPRHVHSHLPESASVPKTLGHLREDECAGLLPAKCRSEEKLGARRPRSSTQDSHTSSVMEEGSSKAATAGPSGPAYSYQNCDIILKDPRNEVKYFWIDGEVLAVPKAGAKFKKATFLARKQTLARKICSCVAVVFVLGAIIAVVVFITLRPAS